MSPESEQTELLRAGDGVERIAELALRAIETGTQVDESLYISIPAEPDMTYWATGIWHVTDEGRMIRANELLSEIISEATGRSVWVYGSSRGKNTATGEIEASIGAVIRD